MKVFKEYLVKLLGGYTQKEMTQEIETLKDSCEKFYEEYCHLYGNNHSWKGTLTGANTEGKLIAVRSNLVAHNCVCSELVIAPWVRGCYFSGIQNIVDISYDKTYAIDIGE